MSLNRVGFAISAYDALFVQIFGNQMLVASRMGIPSVVAKVNFHQVSAGSLKSFQVSGVLAWKS